MSGGGWLQWPDWAPSLSVLEHAAFVAGGLLVYVLVTRAGHQRRHSAAAIGWVVGIAAFPYAGLPLYLIFGTRKFARPVAASAGAPPPGRLAGVPGWASSLLSALGVRAASTNVRVRFLSEGRDSLDALLALCATARSRLDVCTFILGGDAVGRAMVQALAAAVQRGVACRLIIDAVGSLRTPRSQLAALRSAGVAVRVFMPLLHNPLRGRTNLRNHRKLAVADGWLLWAGGQNLADEYFLDAPGAPAWIDLGFRVEGPVAAAAQAQFDLDWQTAGGAALALPPCPGSTPVPTDGPLVQWIPTGPDRPDDTVHALLLAAAYHAEERILAVTPYFVPDEALLDAWCLACRRGVQLTLVMPRRSNHRLADIARERALRRLVQAGARVCLLPRMLHAKAVIVDRAVGLCGSVNLDGRSLFLNYEAMAAFYSPADIDAVATWGMHLAGAGDEHRAAPPSMARDLLEGTVRALAFQL
ncbi:MAG TPA: phospholipase D-like domain-containing protein [Burkholderiaceae bacterium]|nr:phospholipase D-like domain-containing protein [Burkholderiaceae bacterium]